MQACFSLRTQASCTLPLNTALYFTSPQITVLEVHVFVTFFVSASLSLECYIPTRASTFYLPYFKSYLMSQFLCKTQEAWINLSRGINVCFLPTFKLIEGRDKTLLSSPPGTWESAWNIVGTQGVKCLSFCGTDGHRRRRLDDAYFIRTSCKSFSKVPVTGVKVIIFMVVVALLL